MKLSFNKVIWHIEDKITTCTITSTLKSNHYAPRMFLFKKDTICKKDDAFDANKGAKIALAKTELKAYKVAKKFAKKEYNKKLKELNELLDFINKSDRCIKHNIDYIKKLSE